MLVNPKSDSNYGKYADMLIFEYELRSPPVPVPAAVWLMGTGLAGLVALKRKKSSDK